MKKELYNEALSLIELMMTCNSYEEFKELIKPIKKQKEIEASWATLVQDSTTISQQMQSLWEAREDMLEKEEEDRWERDYEYMWAQYDKATSLPYSDEELQNAFDFWDKDRRKYLIRIGREAQEKGVSRSTISRFFKDYDLSPAEITVFWLAYMHSIYPMEEV